MKTHNMGFVLSRIIYWPALAALFGLLYYLGAVWWMYLAAWFLFFVALIAGTIMGMASERSKRQTLIEALGRRVRGEVEL